MINAKTEEELEAKLSTEAYEHFEQILDRQDLSKEVLKGMNSDELRSKLDFINNAPSIKNNATIYYKRDQDFSLPDGVSKSLIGWEFNSKRNLLEKKALVKRLINKKTTEEKLRKLDDLVKEKVNDEGVRGEIKSELQTFESDTEYFGEDIDIFDQIPKVTESKKDLDLKRLKDKVSIFRQALEKEYVTTFLGAILLVLFSICILVAMFLKVTLIKEIETAFLLILGYFFGQAVSKK